MVDEDDQALQEEQDAAPARAPWTIKSVSRETRDLVMEAAASCGESAGAWLERVARAPEIAERADQGDRAQWTIKAMLVEDRQQAVRCAAKRGEQIGFWVARVIRAQAALEGDGASVAPAPPLDVATMTTLLRDYVALAASAKVTPDKGLVEEYAALLRELMRRMREVPGDPR